MAESVDRPNIPEYELLRPIGRGAYGEVWLARNVVGTLYAIKIIWRRRFESERPFEREFAGIQRYEPVSRSSGGLVHVLHLGRHEAKGYFYYVMELADSAGESGSGLPESRPPADPKPSLSPGYQPRTLRSELKRRGRLPTSDCLRLALEVSSGLEQLHRNGLVHRDVKPGNIIYVNGRAKLADIGLVTADGEGRTFVGTEGYVPPEGPGSPGADLYALGMVLYEASTGLPIRRLPDVPPDWLTAEDGHASLELHEVVLKAGEAQRERRYASIEALRADLAVLQSGQSVRRMHALERRYARLRIAGAAVTALMVCALGTALFANYRAHLAAESRSRETALRIQAEQSLRRAESAEHEARHDLYAALLAEANATVRSGEAGQRFRALEAVRRAAAITNSVELRGAALAALALPDFQLLREIPKSPGTTLVQLDPSFERMAIGHGEGPIEIRSVADQRLLQSLPARAHFPAFLAWWSSDGRYLAVKRDWPTTASELEIWDLVRTNRILLIKNVSYDAVAMHPHQPQLLAGLTDGTIVIWNLETVQQLARFQLGNAAMFVSFSPEGERFVACLEKPPGFLLSVHRTVNGTALESWEQPDQVPGLSWHPSGRWIAAADLGGTVQLIDPTTGTLRVLGHHKAQAVLALFSSDGNYLLSGGWEREFILWDVRRMERAFTMGLNSYRAQFSSDGRQCAVVTPSSLQLHTFERPVGRRELDEDLGSRLIEAVFSPDGRWLAAAAAKRVGVWDLKADGPGAVSSEASEARVVFSRGDELFASNDDQSFRWRIQPGSATNGAPHLAPLPLPRLRGLTSFCFTSNQMLLTASRGTTAVTPGYVGSLRTNSVPTLDGVSGLSRDERFLAIFEPYTPELHVYRRPGLREIAILTNRFNIVRFEFAPAGGEVAVSTSGDVEIWSTTTWHRVRDLTNFVSLLYGPDGRTSWLRKDYQTAGLYDTASLEELLPLPPGTLPLALSPDGRSLVVSVNSRHLQVWDLVEVQRRLKELGLGWAPRSKPEGTR
jgi:serine/threonine protein kinase/WD40 repeat protein